MISRIYKQAVVVLLAIILFQACQSDKTDIYNPNSVNTAEFTDEVKYIREWNELLYFHIKHLVVGPPVAARMFGYLGVTVYESLVGGMPQHQSLAGQLNGLEELPRTDPDLEYDWPTVMIEAMFYVTIDITTYIVEDEDGTISGLRDRQLAERAALISKEVMERSTAYGKELALAIIDWAAEDNYQNTRQYTYQHPSRVNHRELWEPTDINVLPLEPFWGRLRPFAIDSANTCPIELVHEYSEEEGSGFYQQAMAVYEADQNLTEEQRSDALYWADCPGETATPPGHWMFIMGYVANENKLNLEEAAEMYAITGIGIADAFIQCWHTKYHYNLVRPKTYIHEVLNIPDWEPLVVTPPFPEYTSGHSIVSSCAAELLTAVMGDELSFTDSTHVRIGLGVRRFNNFREAARQAVNSRLYGGMHYPMANEEGQKQGICLANTILEKIHFRKEQ